MLSIPDLHFIRQSPINFRAHICHGGYIEAGISVDAWKKIALEERNNNLGLNRAMIEDITDVQSSNMAQSFFREEIEEEMRKNGDIQEIQKI